MKKLYYLSFLLLTCFSIDLFSAEASGARKHYNLTIIDVVDGKIINIMVNENTTIRQIKDKISSATGLEVNEFNIALPGTLDYLKDRDTLKDLKFNDKFLERNNLVFTLLTIFEQIEENKKKKEQARATFDRL